MKAKYILSGLLMVALVIGGMGYDVAAKAGDKITGGGTFTCYSGNLDYNDHIMSFGFNAKDLGAGKGKGQFTLIDHTAKTKIFGTISGYSASLFSVSLEGMCSIDGVETSFRARVKDKGEGKPSNKLDVIEIWFGGNTGRPDIYGQIGGEEGKGNIQRH